MLSQTDPKLVLLSSDQVVLLRKHNFVLLGLGQTLTQVNDLLLIIHVKQVRSQSLVWLVVFPLLCEMLIDNKASPLLVDFANEPVVFDQLDSNLHFLA